MPARFGSRLPARSRDRRTPPPRPGCGDWRGHPRQDGHARVRLKATSDSPGSPASPATPGTRGRRTRRLFGRRGGRHRARHGHAASGHRRWRLRFASRLPSPAASASSRRAPACRLTTSPLGTMAHTGPLTRTVADAALAPASSPPRRPRRVRLDEPRGLLRPPRRRRAPPWPWPGPAGWPARASRGRATVASAARVFESLGAIVEEPSGRRSDPIAVWDASRGVDALPARAPRQQARRDLADPGCHRRHRRQPPSPPPISSAPSSSRTKLRDAFVRFHRTFDLLLAPALPLPA